MTKKGRFWKRILRAESAKENSTQRDSDTSRSCDQQTDETAVGELPQLDTCRCSDTTDSSSETSSDEHKGTSSKRSSLRVRFSAAIDSVRNRIYKDSTPTKKYLKNYNRYTRQSLERVVWEEESFVSTVESGHASSCTSRSGTPSHDQALSRMSNIDEENELSTVREVRTSRSNNVDPAEVALEELQESCSEEKKLDESTPRLKVSPNILAGSYPSMTGIYAQQRYLGSSPRQVQNGLAQRVSELEQQLSRILQVVDKHLCVACGNQLTSQNDEATKNNSISVLNSSSKPRIRSPPGKNDHGAGAGAGINVGASGDASRETRSATPPRSSMTRHPSPGPRGNSASSSGGKRQPSPCAAPTGFAAYKHLFDCIDYRYLPSTESASLTCELLHHMLTNNQAAKLRLERAYESVRQQELPGSTGLSLSKLDQLLYNLGLVETKISKEVVLEMVKVLRLSHRSRIQLDELIDCLKNYKFERLPPLSQIKRYNNVVNV